MQKRCVVTAGQQRPALSRFPAGGEITRLVEPELIRPLPGGRRVGPAARTELRAHTVTDGIAVPVGQQQLRRGVGIAGIHKGSALCGRIFARDVKRAEILGLRHAQRAGRLAVDADGERVKAVVRGGKLCDVDGLAERFYALAALQLHGRVRAVLRVHRHGEAAQIRARGQKQILRRVHAQAGHGTPIHLRVDRAEQFGRCKRAFWQRRHRDRVGVVRREIPPAVHLRAAGQAERVRRCRRETRDDADGLCGQGQSGPGAAAVGAHLDAVVFRTSGRRPVETDLLLADLGRSRVPDTAGQDLILRGHRAVEVAHAPDRDGAETDARVVRIGDAAIDVRFVGPDRQLPALIRDRNGADGIFAVIDRGRGLDLRIGNILSLRAALRADMISIPAVARIAEHRAAAGLAAGPAGGDGIAVRGAGAGVDRLRVVNDAVIVEVIRPAVELLPAGDMLAGQEIHPVGRALDRQPAGVLRGPDVDCLPADRAHGLSAAAGRQRVAVRAAAAPRRVRSQRLRADQRRHQCGCQQKGPDPVRKMGSMHVFPPSVAFLPLKTTEKSNRFPDFACCLMLCCDS